MKVHEREDHANRIFNDDGAAYSHCPLSPLSPAESLESLPPDTPADHHHAILFKGGPSTGGITGDGMCDNGIYARLGYPSPPSTTSDPKHPVPLPTTFSTILTTKGEADTNTTTLALRTTPPDHDDLNDYLDFDIDLCYELATLSFPSTSASAPALVYFGGLLDSPRVDVHRHSRHQALIGPPARCKEPVPPSPPSPMRSDGTQDGGIDAEEGMGAPSETDVGHGKGSTPQLAPSSPSDSIALLSPLSPEWSSRALDDMPLTKGPRLPLGGAQAFRDIGTPFSFEQILGDSDDVKSVRRRSSSTHPPIHGKLPSRLRSFSSAQFTPPPSTRTRPTGVGEGSGSGAQSQSSLENEHYVDAHGRYPIPLLRGENHLDTSPPFLCRSTQLDDLELRSACGRPESGAPMEIGDEGFRESTSLLLPPSPERDVEAQDAFAIERPRRPSSQIAIDESPESPGSPRQSRSSARRSSYLGVHHSHRSRSTSSPCEAAETGDPPRSSRSHGTAGSHLDIYPSLRSRSTSSIRSTGRPVLPLLDIPHSNHTRSYNPSPSSPLWLAQSHLPSPTSPSSPSSPSRQRQDTLGDDQEMVSPPSSGPPQTPSPDFGPLTLLEDVYQDHQLADLWDLDGSGSLGLDDGSWEGKPTPTPSSPDASPAFEWLKDSVNDGPAVWNAYDHDPRLLQSPSSALRSFSDLPSSPDEYVSPGDPYDSYPVEHSDPSPIGPDFDDCATGPLLFEFTPTASPVFSRATSPEHDFDILALEHSPLLKGLNLPSEEESEVKACIRLVKRAEEAERFADEKDLEVEEAKSSASSLPVFSEDLEFKVLDDENGKESLVRLQREAVEARAIAKREREKAREVGALVRAKLREGGWGQDTSIWEDSTLSADNGSNVPVSPRLQKTPRMASVAHLVARMFLNRHDLPSSPPRPSPSLLSTSTPSTIPPSSTPKTVKYKYRPIWLRSLAKTGAMNSPGQGLKPGDTRATYQKRYKFLRSSPLARNSSVAGDVEEEEEGARDGGFGFEALRRPSLWDAEGELDAL